MSHCIVGWHQNPCRLFHPSVQIQSSLLLPRAPGGKCGEIWGYSTNYGDEDSIGRRRGAALCGPCLSETLAWLVHRQHGAKAGWANYKPDNRKQEESKCSCYIPYASHQCTYIHLRKTLAGGSFHPETLKAETSKAAQSCTKRLARLPRYISGFCHSLHSFPLLPVLA